MQKFLLSLFFILIFFFLSLSKPQSSNAQCVPGCFGCWCIDSSCNVTNSCSTPAPTPAPTPPPACVPSFAVSCSPTCTASTCGQSTQCIDNCGNTFTGQCDPCSTFTCTPTITSCPCSASTCGQTVACQDDCGHTISTQCGACGTTVTQQKCLGGQWVTTSGPSCQASCVQATPPPCDQGSNNCGNCSFACGPGTQTCQHNQKAGGGSCTPTNFSQPCNQICPAGQNCVSNVCVLNKAISGSVYLDTNKNQYKDAGELNYTGSITITSSGGTVSTSNGNYTINGLTSGSYTVSYTSLPTGYQMTYPIPPSFAITVGASCSTGGAHSAVCDVNGNITNLNFGITNLSPWMQCQGGDCRIDNPAFISKIPQNSSCGNYASLNGSGGTPGLIFSGAGNPDFGSGQASTTNWVAGGTSYPESYSPIRQGSQIKTSYAFLLGKAAQGNVTITDISSYCGSGGISNCSLSSLPTHGIYQANGSLKLTGGGLNLGGNQNFVILVNGDLTIAENITVPQGSTAIFSASGNIQVDKSIGEGSVTSTAPDIQGIFSADKSFIAQGTNNCTLGTDLRLNVAGAIITNAGQTGGSFQNLRDLCGGDVCPAFYVSERPDFILNTPDFIKQPNFTYQEIAP